jgi:hypothetical protein
MITLKKNQFYKLFQIKQMVIKRIWAKYKRKTNWRNVWKFKGLSMEIEKNVEKDGKIEKKMSSMSN